MNNRNTKNSKNSSNKKSSTNTKNVSKAKKLNKNDSNRIAFLLFAVVMFIVVLISTIFNDLQQIIDNKRQTEELSQRYQQLLEEEASLNSEVIKLQDPNYLKRYAREKYMYTLDGEKILTIIEKDELKENEENKENKDSE